MGAEIQCKAKFGKQSGEGRALLETNEILFRGEFRLKIPLKEIKSVKAVNDELRVRFTGGEATFAIGAAAEKWAHKILHPKTVMEKLGVKEGTRVVVLNIANKGFLKELSGRATVVTKLGRGHETIFFGVESRGELKRVPTLGKALAPAGGLWIVYPKGQKEITEMDVITAGRAAGLKDVKVVGFSATHTALKFVIPIANR
jgi:hypothetical protein